MSAQSDRLVTDEEMEHFLMFPDMYCRGHDGGAGPLCVDCLNDLADVAAESRERP